MEIEVELSVKSDVVPHLKHQLILTNINSVLHEKHYPIDIKKCREWSVKICKYEHIYL